MIHLPLGPASDHACSKSRKSPGRQYVAGTNANSYPVQKIRNSSPTTANRPTFFPKRFCSRAMFLYMLSLRPRPKDPGKWLNCQDGCFSNPKCLLPKNTITFWKGWMLRKASAFMCLDHVPSQRSFFAVAAKPAWRSMRRTKLGVTDVKRQSRC